MSLVETLQIAKFHIATIESNLISLESGRKAAAPRARNSIQETRKFWSELRKSTMLKLNTLPASTRVKLDLTPTPQQQFQQQPSPEVEIAKPKRKYVKRSIKKEEVAV